jgi:sugar-specific transcriptional regulator TrmB
MSDRTDNISSLLKPFGLTEEEARIYLVLLEKGTLTALEMSRFLRMGRTKVYRMLDKLKAKGVVSQKHTAHGFTFEANSPTVLELLLIEKRKEVEALEEAFPAVLHELRMFGGQQPHSKVLYYEGQRGLEQVTYNSMRAKGDLRTYEIHENMTAFVDETFAEEMRKSLVANHIFTKQLTNSNHIKPFTKVNQLINWWEVRHIEKRYIDISFEVLIYNEVYVMYAPHDENVFCVEIYNPSLAAMQKQLFDMAWKSAKKMTILNDNGEARI